MMYCCLRGSFQTIYRCLQVIFLYLLKHCLLRHWLMKQYRHMLPASDTSINSVTHPHFCVWTKKNMLSVRPPHPPSHICARYSLIFLSVSVSRCLTATFIYFPFTVNEMKHTYPFTDTERSLFLHLCLFPLVTHTLTWFSSPIPVCVSGVS